MLDFSVNLSATLLYKSSTHMHEFCERATPPTATEGAGESHHFVNAWQMVNCYHLKSPDKGQE